MDHNPNLEVEYTIIWQFLIEGCCFGIVLNEEGLVHDIKDREADHGDWIENWHAA
jgi:hypothetical protein